MRNHVPQTSHLFPRKVWGEIHQSLTHSRHCFTQHYQLIFDDGQRAEIGT